MNEPEVPFDHPWQAQLFAITLALNESGHFTWAEWSREFGPRVKHTETERYWEVWSEALVALLEARGMTDSAKIEALKLQWQASARVTPHGQPIELIKMPTNQITNR